MNEIKVKPHNTRSLKVYPSLYSQEVSDTKRTISQAMNDNNKAEEDILREEKERYK